MVTVTGDRASRILGVTNDWAAWCLDEAMLILRIEVRKGRRLWSATKSKDNSELLRLFAAKSGEMAAEK